MSKPSASKPRSVKLNAAMRDSLISSVLRDLPRPNFDQRAAKLEKAHCAGLPAKVRACLKDPDSAEYLQVRTHSVILRTPPMPGNAHGDATVLFRLALPSRTDYADNMYYNAKGFASPAELFAPLGWASEAVLEAAAACANETLGYLKAKRDVILAVRACNTVQHLRDRHPHFNKYTDEMLADFLPPAISNLPDDSLARTLERLGWPDGGAEAEAEAEAA